MAVIVPDDRRAVGAVAAELLASEDGDEVAEAVLEALKASRQPDPLDPSVWGPAPTNAEVAHASAQSELRMRRARERLLAEALTREEAAARLGVGERQISKLIGSGELVSLEDGRERRLPAWQFDADTSKGRLEGIRELAHAFSGGPLTLSLWAVRPNPALGRRTPAQALADGDVDAVVTAASAGV